MSVKYTTDAELLEGICDRRGTGYHVELIRSPLLESFQWKYKIWKLVDTQLHAQGEVVGPFDSFRDALRDGLLEVDLLEVEEAEDV